MNVYLSSHPYGSRGFVDPGLFDTRLTPEGEAMAAGDLREAIAAAHAREPIELWVSSPLTRAIRTADLGLGSLSGIARTVSPLLAERRYLSSDVGQSPGVLRKEFPAWFADGGGLPERWWWEGSEAEAAASREARFKLQQPRLPWQQQRQLQGEALAVEPEEHFVKRMRRFLMWLEHRPERRVAIVAHWGVHYSLLGRRSLANCELVECAGSELDEPVAPPS